MIYFLYNIIIADVTYILDAKHLIKSSSTTWIVLVVYLNPEGRTYKSGDIFQVSALSHLRFLSNQIERFGQKSYET